MRGGWYALCAVAQLAFAAQGGAQARRDDAVHLAIPDCLGIAGSEVSQIVELELEPRLHTVVESASARTLAEVRCSDGRALIRVADRQHASTLTLELELASAAPQARPRLLALAVAELIATSRLERAGRPRAGDPGQPDAAAANDDDDDDDDDDSNEHDGDGSGYVDGALTLWLGPGLSWAGTPRTATYGIDGGGLYALGSLAVALDLQARWGSASTDQAHVAIATQSAALSALGILPSPSVRLLVGAGLRVGHVAFAGEARSPTLGGRALDGWSLGPLASGAVHIRGLERTELRIALELGYTLKAVRGLDERDQPLAEVSGVWASANLGLAVSVD